MHLFFPPSPVIGKIIGPTEHSCFGRVTSLEGKTLNSKLEEYCSKTLWH